MIREEKEKNPKEKNVPSKGNLIHNYFLIFTIIFGNAQNLPHKCTTVFVCTYISSFLLMHKIFDMNLWLYFYLHISLI